MYVSPVVIPQVCDFLKFLMVRKVNDLFANEPDIVFILDQVDLLLVIHDEERLSHFSLQIILNILPISLKSHEPTSRQLEYLLLRRLILQAWVELNLNDLLGCTLTFGEKDLLIVPAY